MPTPGEHIGSAAAATGATASSANSSGTWPTSAGSLLVAVVERSGGLATGALTGVTDSAGNSGWAMATRGAVSGVSNTRTEVWYCPNAAAVTSITFASSTSQTYAWNILDISGMATSSVLDVASTDGSGSASSSSAITPNISTSNPNDIVIAGFHSPPTTPTLNQPGWTELGTFNDGTNPGRAAWIQVSSTGTYSATWNLSPNAAAGIFTVAFKIAAGATTLTVQNVSQAQTVGNAILTVGGTSLTVAKATTAQTEGNVVLTFSGITLTVQKATTAQTAGNVALTLQGQLPAPPTEITPWWMPTGDYNPNGLRPSLVLQTLTGKRGSRRWSFRYELLDSNLGRKFDLEEVQSCTVTHQYLADIKRQATFTIRDIGRINYLSDKIRPWVRLHVLPFGDLDYVEWPLGVFNLVSPVRHANEFDTVDRQVEGFDMLQELSDNKTSTRYSVAAGANVVAAVYSLISYVTPKWAYTRGTETLTATKEWPPGTSHLQIANDLLAIAEYGSVSFNSWGTGVLAPYKDPSTRPVIWTYTYGDESLIIPDVDQELDIFSVPNKIVAVVSEPDQPMLVASATNSNPVSPTSTVRRGRTIVEVLEQEEATSQAVLQARVNRTLFERAQIYEHLTFQTALMPFHGTNDVIWIDYDPLAINAKFAETSWEVVCEAGAPMKHEARRIVSV